MPLWPKASLASATSPPSDARATFAHAHPKRTWISMMCSFVCASFAECEYACMYKNKRIAYVHTQTEIHTQMHRFIDKWIHEIIDRCAIQQYMDTWIQTDRQRRRRRRTRDADGDRYRDRDRQKHLHICMHACMHTFITA